MLYSCNMCGTDLCHLRYAKMQYRSLPSTQYLVFDDVVPNATSTARVAAAALYHCLGGARFVICSAVQANPLNLHFL